MRHSTAFPFSQGAFLRTRQNRRKASDRVGPLRRSADREDGKLCRSRLASPSRRNLIRRRCSKLSPGRPVGQKNFKLGRARNSPPPAAPGTKSCAASRASPCTQAGPRLLGITLHRSCRASRPGSGGHGAGWRPVPGWRVYDAYGGQCAQSDLARQHAFEECGMQCATRPRHRLTMVQPVRLSPHTITSRRKNKRIHSPGIGPM